MREIKFRQWLHDHFQYWGIFENGFCSPSSSNIGGGLNALNTTHEQYTGLKDKNGVEIYEGDVLKCTNDEWGGHKILDEIGEVKYLECAFLVDTGDDALELYQEVAEWEIIGNIHENPELLKRGE